jgi:pseudaminic acid synthase
MEIAGRRVGAGAPAYVVAEISANHAQDFEQASALVRAAKDAGADAVKLQTYTPDTITLRSDAPQFRIEAGTMWDGRTLYDLYAEAYMPWDWQPRLKAIADEIDITLFSSPFDETAVELLEQMSVPAYKIASFELVDLPLIRRVAATGKPMIISTGMATLAEIDEAVRAARDGGARQIALLHCTSAYPAPPDEANLRTIPHLADAFGLPVGLSDHTQGIAVPVAAVALGAAIIEKHFTVSRATPTADAAFSLEPAELRAMVDQIRVAEAAVGGIRRAPTEHEAGGRRLRRSLFVVADVRAGERLTADNVRSIRPADGLHTRHLPDVLGRRATRDIARGTPLSWDLLA